MKTTMLLATAAVALGLHALCTQAAEPDEVLHAQHSALANKLARNDFGLPIYLDSQEDEDAVSGDVYAVMDHPFAQLAASMKEPSQWCEVVIVVINVKHCEAGKGSVTMNIGRKAEQALKDTYKVGFTHQVSADSPKYLQVRLNAAEGPMGTHDYRIVLEAVPADRKHSFIHLRYAYATGAGARMAMQAYRGTIGRNKVGFSKGENGELVGGMRGAIERTTMRYYLAISSYLESLSVPREQRVERRLNQWFAATERYPRQLHEMERDEYLALKRNEIRGSTANS